MANAAGLKATYLSRSIRFIVIAILGLGCGNIQSYSQLPSWLPAQGLIGWFPFDGGAGDKSGYNIKGYSFAGQSTDVDRKGTPNSACRFDDTGKFEYEGFPNDLKAYTIAGWFRFDELPSGLWNLFSFKCLAGNSIDNPVNGYGIGISGSSLYYIHIAGEYDAWGGYDYGLKQTDIKIDNFWNFVAITWDGQEITLYYNGIKKYKHFCNSKWRMLPLFQISEGRSLGYEPPLGYKWWKGLIIDNVAVYNRALSYSEILGIYNEENTTSPPTNSPEFVWKTLPSGSSAWLHSVTFPNPDIGYVVGQSYDNTILKTKDGGKSWENVAKGLSKRYSFNSIYFNDNNQGYVATSDAILTTSDGGMTWNENFSFSAQKICFINPKLGYAIGGRSDESQRHSTFRTTTGGITWEGIDDRFVKPERVGFDEYGNYKYLTAVDICFPSNKSGFAISGDGILFRTWDGGLSWKYKKIAENDTRSTNQYKDILFLNAQIGFIIGSDGIILKTIDGGDNWNKITTGTKSTLTSMVFIKNDEGYIVSSGGELLATKDCGNTWNYQKISEYSLNSICPLDSKTLIVVGKNGTIIKGEQVSAAEQKSGLAKSGNDDLKTITKGCIQYKYFFDNWGKEVAFFNGNNIYNRSGERIGATDGKIVYNADYRIIGSVDGNTILDNVGRKIGSITDNDLFNKFGYKIGNVVGNELYGELGILQMIGTAEGLTTIQIIIYYYFFLRDN